MQSHHHHAGGADHAEVGGRRRGVFGGHEGKDEGRWALFCDLVGDDDGGDDDGDGDGDGDKDDDEYNDDGDGGDKDVDELAQVKNDNGRAPGTRILPETLNQFFDECVTSEGIVTDDEFRYQAFIP